MPWLNLARLLSHLRQRRTDPRDVTVFVEDDVVDPRYRHPPSGNAIPEEDEGLDDGDWEED